jgi:hypothetical protein
MIENDKRFISKIKPLKELRTESNASVAITIRQGSKTDVNNFEIWIAFVADFYADYMDWLGYSNPQYLASYLEGNNHDQKFTNPFESVATVFTLISTINQVAVESKRKFVHVARCNHKSRGMFEKLQKMGIYQPCNGNFVPTKESRLSDDNQYLLATFPNKNISENLGEFMHRDSVQALTNINYRLINRQRSLQQANDHLNVAINTTL